jgi:hypothetical protein
VNRRNFIKNTISWFGVAFGGWVSVGLAARPRPNPPPGPTALPSLGEKFSYDSFKAHIGQTFYVYGGKGLRNVVNLKLVAVEGLRRDNSTEQFAVRFLGPAADPLPSGVYQFQHPASSEFRLLIGPTGKADAKGRYYRADFNLLSP